MVTVVSKGLSFLMMSLCNSLVIATQFLSAQPSYQTICRPLTPIILWIISNFECFIPQ